MVNWRIEHATPSLSWSERCQTSFLQHCGRRIQLNLMYLNPVDYSIWSVLHEKVYRSTIANISELASNQREGRFVQSIVDAAIDQWRRRLSAYVRGAGQTLSPKRKVSAILSCIYQKLFN